MAPFYNALISTTRAGTSVLSNRRVQLDVPTTQQRIMAQGAEVPLVLWDVAGSDYRRGDDVSIQSLDGQSRALNPQKLAVGLVAYLPAPLALTRVELSGLGGY